ARESGAGRRWRRAYGASVHGGGQMVHGNVRNQRRRAPRPRRGNTPGVHAPVRGGFGPATGPTLGEERGVVGTGRRVLRHDPQSRVDHGETHRPHGAPSGGADDAAETPGPSGLERPRAVRGYGRAPRKRGAYDLPVREHRRAHRRRIARRRKDPAAGAGSAPEHGAPAAVLARNRLERPAYRYL